MKRRIGVVLATTAAVPPAPHPRPTQAQTMARPIRERLPLPIPLGGSVGGKRGLGRASARSPRVSGWRSRGWDKLALPIQGFGVVLALAVVPLLGGCDAEKEAPSDWRRAVAIPAFKPNLVTLWGQPKIAPIWQAE